MAISSSYQSIHIFCRIFLVLILIAYHSVNSNNLGKSGCRTKCGDLTISYPFGIGRNCSFSTYFNMVCKNDSSSQPKAYLSSDNFDIIYDPTDFKDLEVIDITQTQVRIKAPSIFAACHIDRSENGTNDYDYFELYLALATSSPFTISPIGNKITLISCDSSLNGDCESRCSSLDDVKPGCSPLSGKGCCQSFIASQSKDITLSFHPYENREEVLAFNPCSYIFVGDDSNFTFRGASDLADKTLEQRIIDSISIVLDWQIEDQVCRKDETINSSKYVCQNNGHCVESGNTFGGYRCDCDDGYQGNPYLQPGCQDIDECIKTPCLNSCLNTEGDYTCTCPDGYFGDGKKDGTGCNEKPRGSSLALKLSIGVPVGAVTLAACLTLLHFSIKHRKLAKQREEFFKQNGGLLLRKRLSALSEDAILSTKIFTTAELRKATKNFDQAFILGQGGSGIVYKGVLKDKQVVAIKKSRFLDKIQIDEFINEVIILTQVNHRNVVKLLGCCLETEVPLLVYEYVPKGTLFNHIENGKDETWFSWDDRLRIAIECASALSYLHSAVSTPVIHRDVKSANILIDDYNVAKISDFGASRLVPLDQTRLNTLVLGTLGYLDPEYFRTGDITEKSDIYSYGVVLAELLTGKKPFLDEEGETLAKLMIEYVSKNKLFEIIDNRVRREASFEQLQEFANLIIQCLNQDGKGRPKMIEVMTRLERIRSLTKKPFHHQGSAENDLDSDTEQSDLYTTN